MIAEPVRWDLTESVRWDLMESVERCYYIGPAAGEGWLADLSAFVQWLPRDDRQLVRLALLGDVPDLAGFIASRRPTTDDGLTPAGRLDAYVDWAAGLD